MDKTVNVAIDVGTTKICTLISQVEDESRFQILGVGIEPTLGLKKGQVVDVKTSSEAIARSIKKAERAAGMEITNAVVSLAGAHITSTNNKATVGITGGIIGTYDVERVLDAVKAIPTPSGRRIIHTMQRGFSVDGLDGVRNPEGMYGTRLDVEAHVIMASESSVENLRQAVMGAEVDVREFVLNPIADAEVLLTDVEKKMGVAVLDFGGGTTDLAIYIEGEVWHSSVIPVGGGHISADISQAFHVPADQAEEVKRLHGHALPEYVDDEEFFYCRTFGKDEAARFSRKQLAEVIQYRTEEIFQLVRQEIKRSGFDNLLPAGVVLTGGSSLLPGVEELGRRVLELPVRSAKPEHLTGMVDQLDSPAYTTAVGMLYWGIQMQDAANSVKEVKATQKKGAKAFLNKLWHDLLP